MHCKLDNNKCYNKKTLSKCLTLSCRTIEIGGIINEATSGTSA